MNGCGNGNIGTTQMAHPQKKAGTNRAGLHDVQSPQLVVRRPHHGDTNVGVISLAAGMVANVQSTGVMMRLGHEVQ
jgi:hypothetical protein